MDVVSVPLNDFDPKEEEGRKRRREEGGGGRGEEEGRAKCVEGQALQGVSVNIKRGGCSANLFFFFFLVLLVSVHTPDMTEPIRTLLGMWPNNMKVKGLIPVQTLQFLPAAESGCVDTLLVTCAGCAVKSRPSPVHLAENIDQMCFLVKSQ